MIVLSVERGDSVSDNLASVIMVFIYWGWIPVLAIGKAISWIVQSAKPNNERGIEKDIDK